MVEQAERLATDTSRNERAARVTSVFGFDRVFIVSKRHQSKDGRDEWGKVH